MWGNEHADMGAWGRQGQTGEPRSGGQGRSKEPRHGTGGRQGGTRAVCPEEVSDSHWAVMQAGILPPSPERSPLTFTSIFWEEGGRWAATNQSPGAGWEMLREALLCSILMKKGDCTDVLAGKLVPKGLMTGGAP